MESKSSQFPIKLAPKDGVRSEFESQHMDKWQSCEKVSGKIQSDQISANIQNTPTIKMNLEPSLASNTHLKKNATMSCGFNDLTNFKKRLFEETQISSETEKKNAFQSQGCNWLNICNDKVKCVTFFEVCYKILHYN